MITAKKHRLNESRYVGQVNLAVTACIRHRRRPFIDRSVVDAFVEAMQKHALECRCTVPAYCFMPDHLHLIIRGTRPDSEPKSAMDAFKTTTSLWLVRNVPHIHWQEGYYDHIIREGEDWRKQVWYILENPVRAGLVLNASEHPFSGRIGVERSELFESLGY